MNRMHWLLIVLLGLAACDGGHEHPHDPDHSQASETGHAHDDHEEVHDHEAATTTIPADMAERFGLKNSVAGPAEIVETVRVYGRVTTAPDADVTIHARFPGRVESVAVQVGDAVNAGRILATVESNESLKSYAVKAPRAGVIVDRWVNTGEQTGERALFRIIDLSSVWIEFALFPNQRTTATVGQHVIVRSAEQQIIGEGTIDWIALQARADQAVPARVILPNPDRTLLPGMLVSGDLAVATHPVALAVARTALQSSGTDSVVYVQTGERYEARGVELGREDADQVEVIRGLSAGERYVVENSYLVKADIEKAGAGHEH